MALVRLEREAIVAADAVPDAGEKLRAYYLEGKKHMPLDEGRCPSD
jgi:hypothetical protein